MRAADPSGGKGQPVKKARAKPRPSARARTPWAAGQHPVTWPGESFNVEVLAVHPQMVCLQFFRDGFSASGYLSLPNLKELHRRLGELIAPFEASLAAVSAPPSTGYEVYEDPLTGEQLARPFARGSTGETP